MKVVSRKFFLSLGFFLIFSVNQIAEAGAAMKLSSPSFKDYQMIPKKFTCQDEDINPEFIIDGVSKDTQSLALIVDDPDAPMGTWVHWVVYNMAVTSKIEENSIPGKEGINSFHRKHYGGPCPPSGTHRYFFKIYALDTALAFNRSVDKKSLEKAMSGHILDQTELVGLYKKE